MKILQLGKFYPIRGGVEKVMWDLTKGLSSRGIECDMLCAVLVEDVDVMNGSRRGMSIDMNEYGSCICVPAFRKVAATMIAPSMVSWLRRHRKDYDIIHIHHPDPMACLALRLSGFKGKVVLHWHSDVVKQQRLLKFYLPLQEWLIRRADVIVGTTPVYVKESPYLQGVQDKVTSLPIGIEDTIRATAPVLRDDGTRLVFSLGRLVGYKGFRYLVEAARWLPDDYRIVIGGGGELREELEDMLDVMDLRGKVSLKGYISDEEAAELYNSCDVFVLSSIMKTEAFGIVQIEAMSCGKPVVATRIPGSGTSWVNEDGVSGLNVAPEDPKALADAIVAICGDAETHKRFGAAARERYERMFTIDSMIDGAVSLYGRLLDNGGQL